MRANLNRINNEMLLFRQDFGREFTPLLAPFLSAMRNTFSWISANVFPVFQRLIDFTLAFSEQVHLLNPDLRNLKNAFLPLGDSIRSTLQEMGLMNEKTSTAGLLIATLSVGISKVVPLLQKMVSWTGKVIRFLGKNVVWLKRALKLYVAARVGILAYNLALKAQTVLLPVLRGATFAYNAAMLVATRGIRGATLAMQAFNVATKLNPLGLVVGLLATAAVSFVSFGNTVDDITAKQRSFNRELIKTNQLLQTGEQVAARTLMGEDVAQLSLQEIRAGMQSLNENIERFKPATIDFGMIGARAVEQDAADLRNLVANRNRLQAELDRRNRLLDAEGAGTIESPEVTEGIDNITGGGGRVVNVNVSGVKFAENIEINVTSLEEGEDLEEQMREWFVRVLNGGIYTGTQ